ncbi:Double-stranded rna-binding protein [Thalictrum thalictroides]|uniref:Double-stranded rna-binding protein n=1 Tax=Thalictrum thalictroides TaxID=46969 RepID=A0A7J6WGN1_THATH|nr:Double-stranded rna-binding protein [Thalictrum thalictroides]
MYKNRLQEYVQRSALPLPSYHTIKEGVAQFGTFTSTVYVDGIAYKSSKAFSRSKDAEQDAAKVALKSILMKLKDEGCTLISEDIAFCKSILNEFAVKMSLQKPAYTTTQAPGILPIFTSTLVFHGKTYTGKPRRSKKDAEQLVARSVIESILGSESGRHLSQIIITKRKLYATVHNASNNVLIPSSENSAEIENDSEPHLAFQPIKKPKVEHICETTSDPTENEAPLLEQSPCADQGRTASTSGTK